MRRTGFWEILLIGAFLAASCQKEINSQGSGAAEKPVPVTIKAISEAIGTQSKADLACKYDVLWSTGDEICVKKGTESSIFTLASGEGTTVGIFEGMASLSGEVEGFYPSALVEDGSLVWPAVPENNQAPPMYCKKTLSGAASEEFEFKSLGAMLQLVLNSARENTVLKSLSVTDSEKAMSGAFEVIDGKAVITSKDKAGISLNFAGGLPLGISPQFFNVAVPAGEYKDLLLTLMTNDGYRCEISLSALSAIEHNTVCRIVLSANAFAPVRTDDSPALPGRFTVKADGGQVRFSSGNLQARYDGSSYYWDFAANQYDVLGVSMDNKKGDTYTLDMFAWSSLNSKYGINPDGEKGNERRKVFVDWGKAYCASQGITPETAWRTLSKDEWDYLINGRPASIVCGVPDARYVPLRVVVSEGENKEGYVLLPDDYAHPHGLPKLNNINGWTVDFASNTYSLAQWKKLEEAGAVFIPAWDMYWTGNDRDYWEMYGVDAWTNGRKAPFDQYWDTFYRKCRVRLVTGLMPEVPIECVVIDKSEMAVAVNESKKLFANVLPVNATHKEVTWTSGDVKIATVAADGTVTGVSVGTTTITATAADGKTATCNVTVSFVDVESLTLDKGSIDLLIGQSEEFCVTILPDNASDKTLTWTSSNAGIATVASDGTVTGVDRGSAIITATTSNGIKCTCRVNVHPIISGVYSVGEGKAVLFSINNLHYHVYGGFQFAYSQFDNFGNTFHWSREADKARAAEFDWDADRDESDVLFTNATSTTPNPNFSVDGYKGRFRVLSMGEWRYLLEERSMEGSRYEVITGNSGVTLKNNREENATFYGLVLFPDGFTRQDSWKTDYTTWAQVAQAGIVCLSDDRDLENVRIGNYWTSEATDSADGNHISFQSNRTQVTYSFSGRDENYFVRLVTDCN